MTDADEASKRLGALERELNAHWPHSAERCKSHLDLDSIEPQAVRILARGMRSQRLIAFVGAGASMAYGRLTWEGLMRSLYEHMEGHPGSGWADIRQRLWPKGLTDFLADAQHPLKSQILSDAWRRLGGEPGPDRDQASRLQSTTKHMLEDFQGLVEDVIRRLSAPGAASLPDTDFHEKERARRASHLKAWQDDPTARTNPPLVGLAGVLSAIRAVVEELPAADAPGRKKGHLARRKAIVTQIAALHQQSIGLDSPVRQLVTEWGIRRYITTNYDSEIELGLRALSFTARREQPGEVHRNQYEVLNFGKHETGRALAFALEGPRRHAQVLHIHGDVASASSLIIDESHYQHLYLDDHPLRDLVNNATRANFAANPMLFVGSDVNEDDVLRPMRQFMSGVGHRKDRMAVALFMATRESHERSQQKARLLLKYGVYAIHIGHVSSGQGIQPPREGDPQELWLRRFYKAYDDFKRAFSERKPASAKQKFPSVCKLALEHVMALGMPECIESIELNDQPSLDFRADLRHLQDSLDTDSKARPTQSFDSFTARKGLLLFEVTTNRIMSAFLCAKLISLRDAALKVIRDDTRLALTYHSAVDTRSNTSPDAASEVMVHRRHAVSLTRDGKPGRFAPSAGARAATFDEQLVKLIDAAQREPKFVATSGRRVMVVCGARGFGKGAQSDRLIAEIDLGGGRRDRPFLTAFLQGIGGYADANADADPGAKVLWTTNPEVIHINLSFSNELGRIISQVSDVILQIAKAPERRPAPVCKDQIELLERGLRRFALSGQTHRLLIVLGNAGVLFDSDGHAKNGQILRVLRMLLSERFESAPMDLLMYVGEAQVPAALRITHALAAPSPPATPSPPSTRGAEAREASAKRFAAEKRAADRLWRASTQPEQDRRLRRRLQRLNIRTHLQTQPVMLVHALSKLNISDLAATYFPNVASALEWDSTPSKGSAADSLARDLYFATGGSRFAQTVILALLEFDAANPRRYAASTEALANEILVRLSGSPSGSAVETVIEIVLDRWALWHQMPAAGAIDPAAPTQEESADVWRVMKRLEAQPTAAAWQLATELIWHLSAFSHPVEREVLLACPRVLATVNGWKASMQQDVPGEVLVEAMLELLTHWCLIFRIDPRPLPGARLETAAATANAWLNARYRYAAHRHMQRHFLRLMGGRNVETTQWDQFTTTIYASLPDEAPSLRPQVHRTLTDVVQTLTAYPVAVPGTSDAAVPPRWPAKPTEEGMVREADRIRAAYYLVRSTYSLGVVSHLSPDTPNGATSSGHMEEYRRVVRWITHAAYYWEKAWEAVRCPDRNAPPSALDWSHPGLQTPGAARKGGDKQRQEMGIFYPGELIWLYNECGVISLAQGKLQDAEQLLSMAEQAARKVEADDSGSLHTRIRIHTALVQIERGRPHRARQILRPIEARLDGHSVPPLLASSYLGLVEHIGGNYELAMRHYDKALKGLRSNGRSRAAAFALIGMADLHRRLRPNGFEEALAMAGDAVNLAQQGGHEDLRVMATLAHVRICVEANRTQGRGLFERLSFAQRYAAQMDIPRIACDTHELRARLLLLQGEYHLSAIDATASLEIAAMYDLKLKKARGLLTLAWIYRHRGEIDDALSLSAMGREIAASCDYYACVRGFKDLELSLSQPAPLGWQGAEFPE